MRWGASSSAKPACWSTRATSTACWRSTPSAARSRSRAASSGRSCSSISIASQEGAGRQWGIYQKQTGADRLSIGGALACNAHGRGLNLKPIVQQVEEFDLVDAAGELRTCSRDAHPDLFRLAIGGYGLFGIVTRVRLALRPRVKVRRVVMLAETPTVMDRLEERIRDGYQYGDYQFATDFTRDSFLRRGVFSCYQPVPDDTPLTEHPTRFNPEDWARLTFYSHRYKRRAFEVYSTRYLKTSGQIYWADWQLSAAYVDNYHADLDRALHAKAQGSEMITEIYVPRPRLAAFMEAARGVLGGRRANVIYGTVRLIERDDETFLAWARERYACVIFNLHVEHTPKAIAAAADAFRALDRSRDRTRRQLLPDVSPMGAEGSGGALLSADARVPRAQAAARSRRGVSEQLVPALPRDVRDHAQRRSNADARRTSGCSRALKNSLRFLRVSALTSWAQNDAAAPKWTRVDAPRPWATAKFSRRNAAVSHTLPP